MMDITEFDEIRPYHDEELPQILEELIVDPAFQKAASTAVPNVPFDFLAEKCVLARLSWTSRKLSVTAFCGR
ncbi:hypothetical protein JCM10003_1989 [Bacteroides pyogenes JCM 10003]|nr:hypothetical protein JCM10003_1989 [Bacteroides pyogenes JCM 10003]